MSLVAAIANEIIVFFRGRRTIWSCFEHDGSDERRNQ